KYECHVVTLPGFAGVAPIDTPILKTVKNSLVQYIHEKQLKKPILIGHSLGAMMSLWIGSEMPGDISAIICVDGVPAIAAMTNPAINYDSLKKSPVYDAATVATNFVNLPVEGYEKNMTMAMLAQVNDTARAKQIAHWSAMSDRKTLGYTIVEISLTDLRPALKNIKCPVLVMASIYGDKETSLRVMNEQYANVANKKILVADAKHFIMYDQPQWMYAAIDQFLKK
ncbi:MAG: alpha/beta hydrolase, partial [Sphingobacteriales bacterium]